ncbi:hypothetical protein KY320_02740 [Candidatus Woesearchaeota archaeon]|nr:hypothetical protein [Candidatus Woesearchaeota archaeon]
MKKRASVELSANFLVIIVIAIVILGMGIVLTKDIISEGTEMQTQLDERTKAEIWDLLDSGDPVVSPLNSLTIKRGDYGVYGIGVRNIDTNSLWFKFEPAAQSINGCDAASWETTVPIEIKQIEPNRQDIFTVAISVPKSAKPCTYVFKVEMKKADTQSGPFNDPYGTIQKLYVKVP